MDQLLMVIKNAVAWAQKPAIGFFAVCLLLGGYHFKGGAEGADKGKKTIKYGVIALVIVKLAQVLADDFSQQVQFGLQALKSIC